jgi:hypothetical protein
MLLVVGGVAVWVSGVGPGGRCRALEIRYGLTPCPPDPLPVEAVPILNVDPALPAAEAQRIGRAYLRSHWLYYAALDAGSDRFFRSRVIHLPDASPLMFGAEVQHIGDARAAHGRLVVTARATLRGIRIVPLPAELRASLGPGVQPMADAIVIDSAGPETQVIRVRGQPDQTVAELASGDSVRLLVGGVLLTAPGLPETFAELGQWECLDPDTHGACLLPPS